MSVLQFSSLSNLDKKFFGVMFIMFALIKALHANQQGQGLVFAALSFLIVLTAVTMVYNVGCIINTRILVQNAADSAALSAATIQANCMSTIAWINNATAQIYHSLLRQMADITTFAVLAEFEDPGGVYRRGGDFSAGYPAPASVVWGQMSPYDSEIGIASPQGFACQKLTELTQRAEIVFPEAKLWLMQLSHIQQTVALVAPVLINDKIDEVVSTINCTNKSVFFGSRWYPFNSDALDMLIEKLTNGWRVTVTRAGEPTEIIEVIRFAEDIWIIKNTKGLEQTELVIKKLDTAGNEWEITSTPPGDVLTAKRIELQNGDLWTLVVAPAGKPPISIEFKPFPDIDPNAFGFKSSDMADWEIYRKNSNTGTLEIKQGGEWIAAQDEKDINGYKVKVNINNWVKVGDASVHLVVPPAVHFAKSRIDLTTPIALTHWSGDVKLRVINDSFAISVAHWQAGPINTALADGRWHKYFDDREDYWWQHRLTEIISNSTWEYNYKQMGSILQWENNKHRFALYHAVRWNYNQDYGNNFISAVDNNQLPPWMYWTDVAPANSEKGIGLTFGAQSPEAKFWDAQPDKSKYYQLRTCWHCGGVGKNPEDTTEVCPVCKNVSNGPGLLTHVCFRPIDTLHRGSDPSKEDWADFITLMLEVDGSYGIPGKVMPPLVLTDEFFKYGINVAVWTNPWPGLLPEADESTSNLTPILIEPLNSNKNSTAEPRQMPSWGCMAVASARAGFADKDFNGYGWLFALDADQREDWVDGVTSKGNLYITEWAARLVSTKTNINSSDLELEAHQFEDRDYDTPVGWLYDIFASGQSFQSNKVIVGYSLKSIPCFKEKIQRRRGGKLQFAGDKDIKFDDYVYH